MKAKRCRNSGTAGSILKRCGGRRAVPAVLAVILAGSSIFPYAGGISQVQAAEENITTIDVTDFGADPGGARDSAEAVIKALDEAERIQEESPDESIVISFPKGEYQIYPDKAEERELYVSNTVGADTTYKDKKIGILVEDLKNITIDGNGSDFIFHGKMTTFAAIRSENVTFEEFSVDFAVPTVVDVTVEETDGNTATVYIPECYNYKVENNSLYWYSDKSPYTDEYYWTGTDKFPNNYPQSIDLKTGITTRSNDLFNNKTGIEDLGNHRVKFTYSEKPGSVNAGMCYQMRPTVRDTPGTFFWLSKDIKMEQLDIKFLHGFGMVGQTSENISLHDVDFKAPENTGRTTAGYADFVQMSGCKGLIDIQDCYFANAHDDPINIHGTFQQVVNISEDRREVTVRYKHNETAGFPSFAAGDEVEFTRQSNMLPVEDSVRTVERVISGPTGDSSEGISLTDTVIRFTEPIPEEVAANEYVAENITYTPSVNIKGNLFRQIPTRGVLVTTRQPVVIEDNVFEGMSMAAIYISCDAQSWYESGRVEDVLIQNNTFYRCGGNGVIFIEPTNPTVSTDSTVHKNIRILNNEFYQSGNRTVDAKSVDGLTIEGNKIYRFNPNVALDLTAADTELTIGQTMKLDVQAQASALNADIYGFNGCKNVVIADNSYDNGLKMNVSISNMQESDVQISEQEGILIGNGQATPAVGTIHYESSDPSVAEVSYDGVVTAVSEGTADITAYSVMNGRKYVSNVQTVNVAETGDTVYPQSVILTSDGDVLEGVGSTMQFTAAVMPENVSDASVTYSVADARTGESTSAAEISADGVLTAKAAGAVEVRATASNGMTARKLVVIKEAGIVLSDAFEIKKETSGMWRLNPEDESLSIWPTGGSEWAAGNGATNIFLTDVPDADTVSVTVKMDGKTQNGYEEGGIVLYKDSDNYTAIQRKHAGGSPNINVTTENAGSPSEAGIADIPENAVYFKLEKTGDSISGFYSIDGSEWTLVRTVENAGLQDGFKAGILCACGNGVTEIRFSQFAVNGEQVPFAEPAVLPEVADVQTIYDAESNTLSAQYDTSGDSTDFDIVRWMKAEEEDGAYELVAGMEGNQIEVPYELSGSYFKAVVIPGISNGAYGEPAAAEQAVKTEKTEMEELKPANSGLEAVESSVDFGAFQKSVYYYLASAPETDHVSMKFLPEEGADVLVTQNGKHLEQTEDNSYEISLSPGINALEVFVTAQDGETQSVYRFIVLHNTVSDIQEPDAANAKLEEVDAGKFAVLDKEFSPEENNYTGKVFAEEIRFTFTAEERNAVIHVKQDGEETASAAHRLEQNLHFYKGENVVEVQVCSEDGEHEQTYRFVFDAPEVIYLSDLAYNAEKSYCGNASENQIQYDKSTGNKINNVVTPADITLLQEDGSIRTFERGIGAHATSDIYFDIEGMAVDTFTTYFGIDQEVGKGESSVRFAFYKDAEEIPYDGQEDEMPENTAMKQISFSVKDAKELRLYADAGQYEWSDHVSYGDAKFTTTFAEKPQTSDDEISTAVLEYALSLAETADTEGVVDSVVKIFNDAKAAAEDILARAQAGDPSVTQEMVDESWQNLIKAMQYLSFKQGDKTDLQKVIDMAKLLDLNEYLDEGRQAFADALAAAEAVLANGDAMQDEVDQSWKDLLKAMSELRLKPNKDALKDLIDEANGMSTEGADEETIAVFQNALASAMSVYDNEQATEEEVAAAEEDLQAALDQLRAAAGDTEDPDNSGDDGNTGNGGSSQDQNGQNSGSSADTSDKDNASAQTDTTENNSAQKSVKTGDTMAPIVGAAAAMMLAAAAGVMAYRRRRETR